MAIHSNIRRAAVVAVALVSAANVAFAADDSGVHAFLSNMFGEAGRQPAAAVPLPASVPTVREPVRRLAAYRPLTIRRHQPSVVAAIGPTKPAKVSIYEDPTLRRGDAVMTADGIRIFAGSRSWPYTKDDFVPLAQAHELDRGTVKVLAELNSLPRT